MEETLHYILSLALPLMALAAVSFVSRTASRARSTQDTQHFIEVTGEVVAYKSELVESVFTRRYNRHSSGTREPIYIKRYYPIVRFKLDNQEYEVVVQPYLEEKPQLHVIMPILINPENIQEAYSKVEQAKASVLMSLIGWSIGIIILCRIMLWLVRANTKPL